MKSTVTPVDDVSGLYRGKSGAIWLVTTGDEAVCIAEGKIKYDNNMRLPKIGDKLPDVSARLDDLTKFTGVVTIATF